MKTLNYIGELVVIKDSCIDMNSLSKNIKESLNIYILFNMNNRLKI